MLLHVKAIYPYQPVPPVTTRYLTNEITDKALYEASSQLVYLENWVTECKCNGASEVVLFTQYSQKPLLNGAHGATKRASYFGRII